jgi:S1-C subfamily serine protease
VRREIPIETRRLDCMILETDAPTNQVDSGGPMLHDRGELVGIVSHYVKDQQQVSGEIDVEEVRRFIAKVLER